MVVNIFEKIIKHLRKAIIGHREDTYVSITDKNAPWIYVSYITDIFFHKCDRKLLSYHQNRKETLVMEEVFRQLGFNVYFQSAFSKKPLPDDISPKLVFGIEPLFLVACEKWPDANKIYYATGAYFEHQNKQIKLMTDWVNQKYNLSIPYRRIVIPHKACQIADSILQIGSKYTVATYPIELQSKIQIIRQSTQSNMRQSPIKIASNQNVFCFIASGGNMLKGIPLLIELFKKHSELELNLVGPIEGDYYQYLKDNITSNIHLHGFIDSNGEKMRELIEASDFILYPSGSEGGVPGAVLNAMKGGLIPVVTEWAAFDDIAEFGFLIKKWDLESLEKGLDWCLSMDDKSKLALKKKCSQYVIENYNIENFKKDFYSYMSFIKKRNQI